MNCMYGNCGECKEKQIETKPFDHNLPVVYSQWVSEKEKREFQNGETKEVMVTKRKEKEISLWIYLSEFTMNYG
jgi:hypothetical protein